MGVVFFYHLTQTPVEVTLLMLLGKARGVGWRVLVRGCDGARMKWLDQQLWLGAKDEFLPHGLAGGTHDAAQPVLLTMDEGLPHPVSCLMVVDGAEVSAEEVKGLERVCILFDGNVIEALDKARLQWKTLTDKGCSAQYWSEKSRKWEKKAEK
ncbi:MAG: DNA polymerase III subunit chi [Paracoccaceae bacterium]|nr:DNA polymerase III subunit chi [Paracoccaceae bacterium]